MIVFLLNLTFTGLLQTNKMKKKNSFNQHGYEFISIGLLIAISKPLPILFIWLLIKALKIMCAA